MKVTISLQEFYDALMTVAVDNGRNYVSVKVQLSSNAKGIELSGYIDGTRKWLVGESIAEICNAFRALFHPVEALTNRLTDVEFEVAQPDKPMDEQIADGLEELKNISSGIPPVSELPTLQMPVFIVTFRNLSSSIKISDMTDQLFPESKFQGIEQKMRDAGFSPERVKQELSFALQMINKSPQLLKCSGESILVAVTNISLIGLSLNPAGKEAYLIPRWSKALNGMEAVLEPGYVGLVKLLTDAGSVTAMNCQLVKENDAFKIDLADNKNPVTHSIDPKVKRGNIIGAYALGTLVNGDRQVEYMALEEIEEIRGRSETYKAFVSEKIKACTWVSDFGEMARKTVIKRIYKFLPRTDQMAKIDQAVQLDNGDYDKRLEEAVTLALDMQRAEILAIPEVLRESIQSAETKEKLKEIYENGPEFHSNKEFMILLSARKKELSTPKTLA
jgi:phage RecT family recombinase